MKKNYIKIVSTLAIVVSMLTACQDAEYDVLENRLFLAETGTSSNTLRKVTIDNLGAVVQVTPQTSSLTGKDVAVKLSSAPQELEAYNKRNGTSLVALPSSSYEFSTQEVIINKGENLASPVNIALKGLTPEMIASGNQYGIAVKMEADEKSEVSPIKGADVVVFSLDQVIESSVPVIGTDPKTGTRHFLKAQLNKEMVLTQWTYEARVNMSGYNRNNQALFGMWGSQEIYIRFGDAPTPFNTLQVKFAGSQFDRSVKEFTKDTWYHIAVTYDGKVFTLYIDGVVDTVTDKWDGKVNTVGADKTITIADTAWFIDGCMMQEVRLWSVARTQNQIKNSQYGVNPKTPGLLMYWKMNEGSGKTLKNSVEGAPDLIASGEIRWLDGVRSDGKGRTNFD